MDVAGASAQRSILDLPGSLGVEVEDVVPFGDEHTNTANTGTGILLVAKICDALMNWGGYSDEDVRKVASLVARNLITWDSSHVKIEPDISIDEHSKTVASVLKALLDPATPRSRHVHINSNEPVLLVNFDQPLRPKDRDRVNDVIDMTVEQLQQQWNIWPVRVYGRVGAVIPAKLSDTASYGAMRGSGFSITLLNVVNTDIGGPSMPQLLDASCDAPEWTRYVRRQVWRGRDLVSRESGEGNWSQPDDIAADSENVSERSFRSENDDDDDQSVGSDALNLALPRSPEGPNPVNWEDEAAEEHEELDPETSTHEEPQQSAHLEENSAKGDIDEDENDVHAARATAQDEPPSQEVEAPERHIRHPTWERHDDSTSLIDLIRSQVSMIAPFGTEDAGHGVGDIEGEVAKSRSEGAESPSTADDEFIVV
ncbi:uncharacterized protein Z520_11378 [Fonsecaea multimorphosa CBS 102226]|uniref:DhaK domain-containing protein n=1 Tax=Fonsecaea multimorphosa CBS 102226 TaxID=1442371 RepID=A0A0D2JIE8_9EURO|nr:uncharacterized protein Z520_11378 [Fonsecaea multimorphosa CBS 102226]KIX92902.1 hypothetical protein Z520_11378 [Fonsecaea multimorphosa CBS 102226]OAL18152.1 hypothetical protein AYO22_10929 [Fonsecaea multimorphosa]